MTQTSRVYLCTLAHERHDKGLDPPGRIVNKRYSAFRIKTVQGSYHPKIPFLNNIKIIVAAIKILPAHLHHKPEVCLYYLLPGSLIASLILSCKFIFLFIGKGSVVLDFPVIMLKLIIIVNSTHI